MYTQYFNTNIKTYSIVNLLIGALFDIPVMFSLLSFDFEAHVTCRCKFIHPSIPLCRNPHSKQKG